MTVGLLRKNVEDIQHKLLECRREVLVGYKFIGDLVDAEAVAPETAQDMLLSIISEAKKISVFDDNEEAHTSADLDPQDFVPYQDLCRVLILTTGYGRRLLNPQ